MDSILFELKGKPLKYANGGGGETECTFIELRAPTGKVSDVCCAIEGLIQSGILSMTESLGEDVINQARDAAQAAKAGKDPDTRLDDQSVLAIMTGGGVDMKKVVLHFRELFREVAWMGGEKQLTVPRMDEMDHRDFRAMMGRYAAAFILS